MPTPYFRVLIVYVLHVALYDHNHTIYILYIVLER